MEKILVLGSYGAGKTRFSNELAGLIKIPCYHLDKYFWQKNWTPPPIEEWKKINSLIVSKNKWIIDGNYIKTLDLRLKAADTIIYIESNTFTALYRVVIRTYQNLNKSRFDIPDNCRDKFSFRFIKSVFYYKKNIEPIIKNKISSLNKPRVFYINHSNASKFYNMKSELLQ